MKIITSEGNIAESNPPYIRYSGYIDKFTAEDKVRIKEVKELLKLTLSPERYEAIMKMVHKDRSCLEIALHRQEVYKDKD